MTDATIDIVVIDEVILKKNSVPSRLFCHTGKLAKGLRIAALSGRRDINTVVHSLKCSSDKFVLDSRDEITVQARSRIAPEELSAPMSEYLYEGFSSNSLPDKPALLSLKEMDDGEHGHYYRRQEYCYAYYLHYALSFHDLLSPLLTFSHR